MLTTAARVSGLTVTVNNDSVWYLYNAFEVKESSIYFSVEQRDIKFMNNFTVLWGLNFLHQPVCRFTFCITLTSLFTPCTKLSSIVESFMNLAACISKFVHKYFCLFVWLEFFVPVEIFFTHLESTRNKNNKFLKYKINICLDHTYMYIVLLVPYTCNFIAIDSII